MKTMAQSESEFTSQRNSTRLRGRLLVLAWSLWSLLIALTVATVIVSLPIYIAQIQIVCSTSCTSWQLTPAEAQSLGGIGFSVAQYVFFDLILNFTVAFIWTTIAGILVWRKPNDWFALLMAAVLITQAFIEIPNVTDPLGYSNMVWRFPLLALNFLSPALFLLAFGLFPDGRFVPRWTRWVFFLLIAFNIPPSFFPELPFADLLTSLYVFGGAAIVLFAQFYRYIYISSGIQRQQTKWVVSAFVWGMVVFLCWYILPLVIPALAQPFSLYRLVGHVLFTCLVLPIPLAICIAILRYRLWDIDIIINRTLVYGILTASVVSIYALLVVWLGTLLQAQGNPFISLVAAGLIAVLFQPLRERLQHFINQLMYGERDDPYRVISRLGQRLEATFAPDAVLSAIVETVAQSLKLPYVAIALKRNEEFTIATSYIAQPVRASTRNEPPTRPEHMLHLPLLYQSEQVGELLLAPRAGDESFTAADRRLLEDLARQAGVAVHAVSLTADLKQLTLDLQHSRERLVTAREEERRRLRRDLHDGLGPQLASLTLKLETTRNRLAHDPVAETLLSDLTVRTQSAVADIRRLVYALRPPALDELGLVPALREQALQYDGQHLSIVVEAPDILPSLSAAVEVAVFRIAQEALTNVVRHSQAHNCTIRLELDETIYMLKLEIVDNGQGLPSKRDVGIGLNSMRERAEELGGTLLIESLPTGGTRIVAQLPCSTPKQLTDSTGEFPQTTQSGEK